MLFIWNCFRLASTDCLNFKHLKRFLWRQKQFWGTDSVVNTEQLNCATVSWSQGENKPGTSSTCSASSTIAACIFFHPPSLHLLSTALFSSWLLLSYLRLPAGAEPPVLLYSHLNGSLTDAGFLAPGSNRPICTLDEVMSGWLCANPTKVAKWCLPLSCCWICIQICFEAD